MDRRTRKTKKALKEALTILLNKKEFVKITVKDLVDEADINRSTFYAHYEGKDDFIAKMFEELMQQVRKRSLDVYNDETKTEYFSSVHSKMIELFELFYEEKLFLSAIMKSDLADDLKRRLLEELLSISTNDVVFHAHPDTPIDMDLYIYHANLGLMGLICRWIETGYKYTPEQLLEEYAKFEKNPPYKFTYKKSSK